MKNVSTFWAPLAIILLLSALYMVSLLSRGILSASEYEFALELRRLFPSLRGTILPKVPAAAATLLTGALLWLTAARMRLIHPGVAPGMYLTFPVVWWAGTSASSAPVTALCTTAAMAGIFLSRRPDNHPAARFFFFLLGAAGAVATAYFAQTVFFRWEGAGMALFPPLFLLWAVRLEKLDDQELAAPLLDRMGILLAILLLTLLALLTAPGICRHFSIAYPRYLTPFHAGEPIYRPALALFIPLLWLYLGRKAKKSVEKVFFLCFAAGFVLLTLPPTLPWRRLAEIPGEDALAPIRHELLANDPVCFADEAGAAAMAYTLNIPVRRVGRFQDAVPPPMMREMMIQELEHRDVIAAFGSGELDSFLPKGRDKTTFASPHNFKLILFPGGRR